MRDRLWFTAFVGTNLCPLVTILKALGFKESCESC